MMPIDADEDAATAATYPVSEREIRDATYMET
jgi:hypothetical protein